MLMSVSTIMETVPIFVSIQKVVIIVCVLLDISFNLTSVIVKVNIMHVVFCIFSSTSIYDKKCM